MAGLIIYITETKYDNETHELKYDCKNLTHSISYSHKCVSNIFTQYVTYNLMICNCFLLSLI